MAKIFHVGIDIYVSFEFDSVTHLQCNAQDEYEAVFLQTSTLPLHLTRALMRSGTEEPLAGFCDTSCSVREKWKYLCIFIENCVVGVSFLASL